MPIMDTLMLFKLASRRRSQQPHDNLASTQPVTPMDSKYLPWRRNLLIPLWCLQLVVSAHAATWAIWNAHAEDTSYTRSGFDVWVIIIYPAIAILVALLVLWQEFTIVMQGLRPRSSRWGLNLRTSLVFAGLKFVLWVAVVAGCKRMAQWVIDQGSVMSDWPRAVEGAALLLFFIEGIYVLLVWWKIRKGLYDHHYPRDMYDPESEKPQVLDPRYGYVCEAPTFDKHSLKHGADELPIHPAEAKVRGPAAPRYSFDSKRRARDVDEDSQTINVHFRTIEPNQKIQELGVNEDDVAHELGTVKSTSSVYSTSESGQKTGTTDRDSMFVSPIDEESEHRFRKI